MRSNISTILVAALAISSLTGCGRHEDGPEKANPESLQKNHVEETNSNRVEAEDFETKKREAEAAREEQQEFRKILQEEIDAYLADEAHPPDEDVLENPIFKRYFDELLADHGMTDDQKSRFGEVVNLLTVVSPEDFDNPDRKTRLGLSGEAAKRLVETSKTKDVKGLIDYLLTEIEDVAFELIDDRPSSVTSRGGVMLHVDES